MLRNRNSFFQETTTNQQGFIPVTTQVPYYSGNIEQTYYQGPNISQNPNMPIYPQNYNQNNDDLDNRISKLERQLNRLDARITKLENASKLVTEDMSQSMYIV